MADKLKEIPAKILEWWNKFTTRQKSIIVGAAAVYRGQLPTGRAERLPMYLRTVATVLPLLPKPAGIICRMSLLRIL